MQYGLKIGWILLWTLPLLLGWHLWARVCSNVREAWVRDRRQLFCGRLAALQKNLEAGRLIWERERPHEVDALWQAEEAALDFWHEREVEDETDCAQLDAAAFDIYRQKNLALPDAYPNWWIRWSNAQERNPAEAEGETEGAGP